MNFLLYFPEYLQTCDSWDIPSREAVQPSCVDHWLPLLPKSERERRQWEINLTESESKWNKGERKVRRKWKGEMK